jgi:uncharacterized protein
VIYLDTSLLIAALCREDKSDAVHQWLADQPVGAMVISHWSIAEVASAVTMKQRMGLLTAANAADVFESWEHLQTQSLICQPVETEDFIEAAALVRRLTAPLRSGDALHLAVGARMGADIATLDKGMARAALEHGVRAHTLDCIP